MVTKAFDPRKCVICQKVKDISGNKRLTNSTIEGREKTLECSRILDDNEIRNRIESHGENIKYHLKTCYSRYARKSARAQENQNILSNKEINGNEESNSSNNAAVRRSSKRRKLDDTAQEGGSKHKTCMICNQQKIKGDKTLYRISEIERAIELLQSSKYFKDDVHTRCILYQSPGDVFAADVYYHKNCFSSYILKFKREVERLLESDFSGDIKDSDTEKQVNVIIDKLDMTNNAYTISSVCDDINESFCSSKKGMQVF